MIANNLSSNHNTPPKKEHTSLSNCIKIHASTFESSMGHLLRDTKTIFERSTVTTFNFDYQNITTKLIHILTSLLNQLTQIIPDNIYTLYDNIVFQIFNALSLHKRTIFRKQMKAQQCQEFQTYQRSYQRFENDQISNFLTQSKLKKIYQDKNDSEIKSSAQNLSAFIQNHQFKQKQLRQIINYSINQMPIKKINKDKKKQAIKRISIAVGENYPLPTFLNEQIQTEKIGKVSNTQSIYQNHEHQISCNQSQNHYQQNNSLKKTQQIKKLESKRSQKNLRKSLQFEQHLMRKNKIKSQSKSRSSNNLSKINNLKIKNAISKNSKANIQNQNDSIILNSELKKFNELTLNEKNKSLKNRVSVLSNLKRGQNQSLQLNYSKLLYSLNSQKSNENYHEIENFSQIKQQQEENKKSNKRFTDADCIRQSVSSFESNNNFEQYYQQSQQKKPINKSITQRKKLKTDINQKININLIKNEDKKHLFEIDNDNQSNLASIFTMKSKLQLKQSSSIKQHQRQKQFFSNITHKKLLKKIQNEKGHFRVRSSFGLSIQNVKPLLNKISKNIPNDSSNKK